MIQLLLPLTTKPRFTLDNLVVHAGIAAPVAAIASFDDEGRTLPPWVLIHGPTGTGKTHILNAIVERLDRNPARPGSHAVFVTHEGTPPKFCTLERIVSCPGEAEDAPSVVAVDDIHLMDREDAANLWTLSNQLTRTGGALIVSSAKPREELFPDNPHLTSRLAGGLVFALEQPDDNARILILDKMAGDRNVRISPDVCRYLVTRKSRNIKELEAVLKTLDKASLELRRRITLPLIKLLEDEGLV